jgi:hypothetical protein
MNIFSRIRLPKLGKNNFDLSYENKLTCQMGQLIPIVTQEVVPGDQFKMSSNILVRFNPMIAPLMHRVDVYTHYFFVPNRLIWDEWEDFITGGEDGLAMPEMPYMTYRELFQRQRQNTAPLIGFNSLSDYIGIPCNIDIMNPFGEGKTIKQYTEDELNDKLDAFDWVDTPFSTLAFRAYLLIYNEYYRNQNTQYEVNCYKGSGLEPIQSIDRPDTNQLFTMRWRNWGLDYFTSALPFSQRGPEQLVPVSGVGGVNYTPTGRADIVNLGSGESLGSSPLWQNNTPLTANTSASPDLNGENGNYGLTSEFGPSLPLSIDNSAKLSVDYADANISIRDLRRAEKIQEFLERSARSGSRYIEQIKGHFGVFSSDKRLDRPEYLGGGKQVVQISSVDQTSATIDGSTPLGSPSGKAISGGTTNGFKTREMEEHGFIIGIMSVLPKGGYHQGLNRKFSRFDKLDYFFPEFQNIGDQEIKTKELFCGQMVAVNNPELGFGYTPRYAEYKVNADEVHGDFKGNLDFWHLNRKFDAPPVISGKFSQTGAENKSAIRQDIFAVQTDVDGNNLPNMYVDIFNNIKARRMMLYYEDPQL